MQNQWTSTWVGASWAMLAQDDTSLKPSWRKMTERIDFSLIFGTILGYQNNTKINKKMKWISDTLKKRVFCAGRSQRLQNGVPKTMQNQGFSEPAKTTESCFRPHAELVFEVWRAPKPHFFQDHFRKPSSCCTGAVVSQIFVENDTPESVQNPSKILPKMKQKTRWKNT